MRLRESPLTARSAPSTSRDPAGLPMLGLARTPSCSVTGGDIAGPIRPAGAALSPRDGAATLGGYGATIERVTSGLKALP